MSNGQLAATLIQQIDIIVQEFEANLARSQYDDCSDVMSETKAVELATRGYAAIERISGADSTYWRRAEEIRGDEAYEHMKLVRLVGVLGSLSADIKAGYLRTFEELIHGELFGDLF